MMVFLCSQDKEGSREIKKKRSTSRNIPKNAHKDICCRHHIIIWMLIVEKKKIVNNIIVLIVIVAIIIITTYYLLLYYGHCKYYWICQYYLWRFLNVTLVNTYYYFKNSKCTYRQSVAHSGGMGCWSVLVSANESTWCWVWHRYIVYTVLMDMLIW